MKRQHCLSSLSALSCALNCVLLASFFVGCGAPAHKDDGVGEQAVKAKLESSAEVVSIDDKLGALEDKAAALKARTSALEAKVVAQLGPTVSESFEQGSEDQQVLLEIDKNSVLRVNSVAMSQSEFQRFAEKRGKALCQPQPMLLVDSKTDYSVVSWVLESIYNQGCAGVEIKERGSVN
ncbi:MAG: hypothetical protein RBU37_24535 [Myxococcota bacterium]|jgi:biopolymer transport protein ExbD|nr:hypothetical protein [Myxococcota bacterium]